MNESEFDSCFLTGKDHIRCYVAEQDGIILGFQSLSLHSKLPSGWVDIATFARSTPKVKGTGTLLFTATKEFSQREKFKFINATIRADNVSGLAYYSKMGFVKYSVAKDIPLQDGTPIDRISKKHQI